jgi:uncharacterized membrane protein (DUF106 family)
MTAVNALLDRTFDLLLGPLRPLPLFASLSVVSLVTAIALLMAVRATSNQRAIAAVKRQIHADLFEIRLFNDDLRAMLRAEVDILRHNATYLRLSLVPMLWMLIPVALVVAQLECHFGYSGVGVGQPVLITAQWKSQASVGGAGYPLDRQPMTLEAGSGIRVETPAIWFPALQQAIWRVVADTPGDYLIRLRIGGETYAKTLHVSNGLARRSPVRMERGLLGELQYPSEAPLPESAPLTSISVAYPASHFDLFGRQVPWIIVYLIQSIIFALVLKTPLRVTL